MVERRKSWRTLVRRGAGSLQTAGKADRLKERGRDGWDDEAPENLKYLWASVMEPT